MEIIEARSEIIDMGYAKAWRLSRLPRKEYDGMPPEEDIVPLGAEFYITAEGMVVELADYPDWPFDEDNNLRKDWAPPAD